MNAMVSPSTNRDLWSLVRGSPWVDPVDLLDAIEEEALRTPHDFRTRLLLRDSFLALEKRSARETLMSRLSREAASAIAEILQQNLGEPGFPTLEKRIMQRSDKHTMMQFLRELGEKVPHDTRLDIGGSGALILAELLRRNTEDLDAVDEVPVALRDEHDLRNSLAARYGLRLTHFQSHYLPQGWNQRERSLGVFGGLAVYLVEEFDILLSKLFSNREKDLDDLRILFQSLDRTVAERRLRDTCGPLLAEPVLRANAERNWYLLFGDKLPA
jgi:hypothetical protein